MSNQTVAMAVIGSIVEIDPGELVLDNNTKFLAVKDLPINDLIESFKAHGQLEPGDVYQSLDGRFHVSGGHRRARTCQELGIPFKAIVHAMPKDAIEALTRSFAGNKHVHLSAMDKAVSMRLFTDAGMKQKEICQQFSPPVDRSYVSMLLGLLRSVRDGKEVGLIPGLQKLLHEGKLTVAKAIALSRLEKIEQMAECEKIEAGSSEWGERKAGDDNRAKSGDEGGLQSPSEADEGKDMAEASPQGEKPAKAKPSTQTTTLKDVKDSLSAINEGGKANEMYDDCILAIRYYIDKELTDKELTTAMVSKDNMAKALEKAADRAERAEKDAEKKKDKSAADRKAARETKTAQSKAAKEALAESNVRMLLQAGFTHVKDNTDLWNDPKGEITVKLRTEEAMALAMKRLQEVPK